MRTVRPALVAVLTLAAATLLTGCGLGTLTPSTPETVAGPVVTGSVHGGQSPVSGAHIHVVEFSAAASALAMDIPTAAGRATDTLGPYVASDANGNFTITGDYTCTSGDAVYLLATQGNPGLPVVTGAATPNNTALAEMAPLGTCPSAGTFSSSLFIGINEVSTVASVYALSGYLTGPASITGYSSTLSKTGLTNAFATAQALLNQATGTALATTAAGGTVPVAKINLLADITAYCINSAGPSSSTNCSTLFNLATATGVTGGAAPTDTITALLNIAHHPATANLAALVALAAANPPYPSSTSVATLHDLTLAVTFPTGDLTGGSGLTIDAAGDTLYASPGFPCDSVTIHDNLGNQLSHNVLETSSTEVYQTPAVVPDPYGNAWAVSGDYIKQQSSGSVKINSSTGASVTSVTFAPKSANALAIDSSGDFFAPDSVDQYIKEYSTSGTQVGVFLSADPYVWTGIALGSASSVFVASSSGGIVAGLSYQAPNSQNQYGAYPDSAVSTGLNAPNSLALDSSQNLWVTNGGNSSIATIQVDHIASGAVVLGTPNVLTGGGLSFDTSSQANVPVVMDGSSNAWIPNYAGSSVSEFSKAGTALSPLTYGFATGCQARGLAVDGSGNVWVTCGYTFLNLVEFIGAATPVATPILPGQQGVRP